MNILHNNLIACFGIALLGAGWSSQVLAQTETNGNFPELKKQAEQLTLENSVTEQQLRKDLAQLTAQKQRLELENAVAQQQLDQQLNKELAKPMAEKRRLEFENSLAQQKFQSEIAALQADIDKVTKQVDLLAKRAALKEAERKARVDDELAADRERLEKMKLTNDLAAADIAAKVGEMARHEQELKVRMAELQTQRTEFDLQLAKLNTDLDLRVRRDLWKNRVNHDIQYTKEPFKDGVLTISDRRIILGFSDRTEINFKWTTL